MPKATRFSFPLAVLLLGCTAMSSNAGWFDFGSKPDVPTKDNVKDSKAAAAPLPAVNLDDSVRQAQMLRLAGSYPEAIKHLSQLMMVASDDPRVVSEYGKTLAAMGRADDAVNFLTRAQQLRPGDWTIYSAMGVAYDQLGNQKDAQSAYERALAIKPGEPSVLSNYALSRMLAKDPDLASKLAASAEIANAGAKDPMIARNIAMIRSMAPEAPDMAMAVKNPVPSPVPRTAAAAPQAPTASPVTPLVTPPRPPALANNGGNGVIEAKVPDNRVVMQRVPVDPLAGPVGIPATHAPRPLQFKTERATAKNEPAAIAAAKTEANKAPATQAAANKPAPVAPKVLPPLVKAADVKPVPAPKVLPPAQVEAAEAKPAAQKTAVKSKDTIPGLRVSTNAY